MTDDDCTKMQKMQFFKQSYKKQIKDRDRVGLPNNWFQIPLPVRDILKIISKQPS